MFVCFIAPIEAYNIEIIAINMLTIIAIGEYWKISIYSLEINPSADILGTKDKKLHTGKLLPSYTSIIQLVKGIHPNLNINPKIINKDETMNNPVNWSLIIVVPIWVMFILPVNPNKYETPNNKNADALAPVIKYFKLASLLLWFFLAPVKK